MALLTTLTAKRSANGVSLAGVAAGAAGDTFINNGQEVLVVTNGSGAPITVTIETEAALDGLSVTDLTATVAAGATQLIGPFPTAIYNDTLAPGGSVSVSYSSETSVTVAVVKVLPA